jgi:hypothetical protein
MESGLWKERMTSCSFLVAGFLLLSDAAFVVKPETSN